MGAYRHPSRDLGGNWGRGGHWIRTEKRRRIYARDNYRCIWCNIPVEAGVNASLDHVVCRERGGTNHHSNLVTACVSCNAMRGEEPAILFVERIQGWPAGALTLDRLIDAMGRSLPDANREPHPRPTPTQDATE